MANRPLGKLQVKHKDTGEYFTVGTAWPLPFDTEAFSCSFKLVDQPNSQYNELSILEYMARQDEFWQPQFKEYVAPPPEGSDFDDSSF